MSPGYLRSHLTPMDLSAKEFQKVGSGRRALSTVVQILWNSLPLEVRTVPTLLAFQKVVKT